MPQSTAPTVSSIRLERHSFLVFWIGQAISLTGSSMAALAIPLLVLQTTGSVARMGLVTALLAVGSLIAGAVSGVLVDRFDRRRFMLTCDALSGLLYGVTSLSWWLAGPHILLLYLLAAPLGFLAVSSSVAATASLPQMVDHDQLTQANARFQMSFALAFLVGPLLAGVLAPLIGAPAILAVNALSFLVSALSLLLIRLRPVPIEAGLPAASGTVGVLLAGVRFILGNDSLRWVVALRVGTLLLIGGAFDLVIFRLKHELGRGDTIVGLVWGLGALGDILAGLLTPRLRRRLGFGAVFLGGQLVVGTSIVIIGLNANVPIFLLMGVCLTFGDILAQITSATLLQEMTPSAVLGRVTAAVQTFLWAGTALGAAASTALAAHLGSTPPIFLLMGCLIGGLALLGLLTPACRPAPEAQAATKHKAG